MCGLSINNFQTETENLFSIEYQIVVQPMKMVVFHSRPVYLPKAVEDTSVFR